MSIYGISPDDKQLLGYYSDRDRRGFRVGIFPLAGGKPLRTDIALPAAAFTPDGRSLIYAAVVGGRGNLFRLPLDGRPPTPLTSFTNDESVMGFALSRDGRQIALSRGTSTSDVVLITREK
jgi:hypothetical protein